MEHLIFRTCQKNSTDIDINYDSRKSNFSRMAIRAASLLSHLHICKNGIRHSGTSIIFRRILRLRDCVFVVANERTSQDRIGLNQGAKCITASLRSSVANPILYCSTIIHSRRVVSQPAVRTAIGIVFISRIAERTVRGRYRTCREQLRTRGRCVLHYC